MPKRKNFTTGSRGRLSDGSANPVDRWIGMQVRARRITLGISQTQLGDALGLSFQQIQKYERGANRIGASRLHDLTRVLLVPIGFFFEGMPGEVKAMSPAAIIGGIDPNPIPKVDIGIEARTETLLLARAYHRFSNDDVRQKFRSLIEAVVRMQENLTPASDTPQTDKSPLA